MAAAYVITRSVKPEPLPYLPQHEQLKSGQEIEFDHYRESDVEELHAIFLEIVQEGQTYPHDCIESIQDFRDYYLSHDAFVVRDLSTNSVLGAFYVKPNFPGRSSHICNGGFIVKRSCRGEGIASFLVPKFLIVARDLGYRASFFNLVYVTNEASLKLWRKFGFTEIGTVPNAGNLKGLGYTDAIQFYYDLTTVQ